MQIQCIWYSKQLTFNDFILIEEISFDTLMIYVMYASFPGSNSLDYFLFFFF